MFTIRNLVEYYTNRKAEVLNKSYSEVINSTSLCIIFQTNNGTNIFVDMHPEMKYAEEPDLNYQRPNSRNVFRKYDFEIISGDNIVFTKGIDFRSWDLNGQLRYQIESPISEKKFNEFIFDNGGINTKEVIEKINQFWSLKSA